MLLRPHHREWPTVCCLLLYSYPSWAEISVFLKYKCNYSWPRNPLNSYRYCPTPRECWRWSTALYYCKILIKSFTEILWWRKRAFNQRGWFFFDIKHDLDLKNSGHQAINDNKANEKWSLWLRNQWINESVTLPWNRWIKQLSTLP